MELSNITTANLLDETLRLALPSDGELHEPSLSFLTACSLRVERASRRRYTGRVPSIPGVSALFQRASDIPAKVEEGSADVGIVGLDRFLEGRKDDGDTSIILEDLGFGECELVLGVPSMWADITSIGDLADLAIEFREQNRELRVATKFPNLVQNFLYSQGISYFTIVLSSGTLEAAPTIGYADFIADLTATGNTLRENGLKTIHGGTVLSSQACLIANRRMLSNNAKKLECVKVLLEHTDAYLNARNYCVINTIVANRSPESLTGRIENIAKVNEIAEPAISPIFASDGASKFGITMIVKENRVLDVVENLRSLGGVNITVSPVKYMFQAASSGYQGLLRKIKEQG